MQTMRQRTVEISTYWYAGGSPENEEDDLHRMSGLAEIIESALEEQDKLTRHAIDKKLSETTKTIDCFDITEVRWKGIKFITGKEAHRIVMTICAV